MQTGGGEGVQVRSIQEADALSQRLPVRLQVSEDPQLSETPVQEEVLPWELPSV